MKQRCREVLEWRRTGLLPDDAALRKLAKKLCHRDEGEALRHAEQLTTGEAMRLITGLPVDVLRGA